MSLVSALSSFDVVRLKIIDEVRDIGTDIFDGGGNVNGAVGGSLKLYASCNIHCGTVGSHPLKLLFAGRVYEDPAMDSGGRIVLNNVADGVGSHFHDGEVAVHGV